MDYYSEVDFGGPDKLGAYYDDPESEMYQMPELEEMENLENENDNDIENENDSHEDSPRPTKKNPKLKRRSTRPKKKKRKRSSSADSFQECDEGEKVIPLCVTNKEINTGAEYQAVVPDDVLEGDPEDDDDRDEPVWQCPEDMDTEKLDTFVKESNERYRIPVDRALYILSKDEFHFDDAKQSVKQMKNLQDIWSEDEVNNFYNCFFIFGKNFKRIRIAMPHRSLTSIVQYYYDSKKRINYKAFAEFKPPADVMNATSSSESSNNSNNSNTETNPILERYFENMCENCGERCENMEVIPKANSHLTKSECRACRLYYEIMDAPRPTSLRLVLSERLKSHYNIPEHMKEFMRDYDFLTETATGITLAKRPLGREQSVEDICGLSYKYQDQDDIKEELIDEPMDVSTEETDEQMDLESMMPITSANDKPHPISPNPVPLIWQQKHTICMEEIEVLADDARRRMFEASVALGRVNKKKMTGWKGEMNAIRNRMERMNRDTDLAPSYLNAKVEKEPVVDKGWSDKDTKSVMKLFQWYGEKFQYIADILGNKTTNQVEQFYIDNRELLEDYMETYSLEMSVRMEEYGLSEEFELSDDDDSKKTKFG